MVLSGKAEKAFLNVYIPCLLLFPTYYNIRLPHLPTISMASGALIPIGVAMLYKPRVPWKFKRMDLWVVLFLTAIGLSETLRELDPKAGLMLWVQDFFEMFLAYIVGRQIIEPYLRLQLIQRMIFCFVIDTPIALYEYRMAYNPYTRLAAMVGINSGWFTQLRNGHARVASCFAHAIFAGMIFVVAIALNHYLQYLFKQDRRILSRRMAMLQQYKVPALALPVLLYLTGSRMPQACGVLCYTLLLIPRFRSMKTGLITILCVIFIGGSIVYAGFEKYTTVQEGQKSGEAQASAIYRKQLLENYAPTLEAGGWLGWGVDSFPRFPGQESVDNNYLILQLAHGKFGRYTFTMLGIEAILSLGLALRRFQTRETIILVFSLMAALIAVFVGLTTVVMFEQVIQVTFLLLGWSQSLQDTSVLSASSAAVSLPEPKFRFRRVIA